MRVYEEYESKAEKRAAQQKAKPLSRKKPTGFARGYCLVFDEDGGWWTGNKYCYSGIANVHHTNPGDGPHSLASASPSDDYLRENARIVGFQHIPLEWQKAFVREINTFLQRDAEEYKGKNGDRYRRLIAAYNERNMIKEQ